MSISLFAYKKRILQHTDESSSTLLFVVLLLMGEYLVSYMILWNGCYIHHVQWKTYWLIVSITDRFNMVVIRLNSLWYEKIVSYAIDRMITYRIRTFNTCRQRPRSKWFTTLFKEKYVIRNKQQIIICFFQTYSTNTFDRFILIDR